MNEQFLKDMGMDELQPKEQSEEEKRQTDEQATKNLIDTLKNMGKKQTDQTN